MRMRTIGPGVGGLNYAGVLRKTEDIEVPARPGVAAAAGGRLARLGASVMAGLRFVGRKLIEARMRQAELEVSRFRYLYSTDGSGGRPGEARDGNRYY
jgi:hypothetical protein